MSIEKTLNDKLTILGIDISAFKAGDFEEKTALLNKGFKRMAVNNHPDKIAASSIQYHLYKIPDKSHLDLDNIEDNAFILIGSNDNSAKTIYFVEQKALLKYGLEPLTITLELSEAQQKELSKKDGKVLPEQDQTLFNGIIDRIVTSKFQFLKAIYDELVEYLELEKFFKENPGLASVCRLVQILNQFQVKLAADLEEQDRRFKEELQQKRLELENKWQQERLELENKRQQERLELEKQWQKKQLELEKQRQKENEENWKKQQEQQLEDKQKRLKEQIENNYQHYKYCSWSDYLYDQQCNIRMEYDLQINTASTIITLNLICGILIVPLFVALAAAIYKNALENEREQKFQAILSNEETWLADSKNYLSKDDWQKQNRAQKTTKEEQIQNISTNTATSAEVYIPVWKKAPEEPTVPTDEELPSKQPATVDFSPNV